jgi:DNA polymerase-3 subunit alpha
MNVLIFDTETTGLVRNSLASLSTQPHITEFYGVLYKVEPDGSPEKIDELEFFANVPVKLEPIITEKTGITNEMLADAKPFYEHGRSVLDLIAKADEVVAHNLSFDMRMVEIEIERIEKEQNTFNWPKIRTCTVEATEHLRGHRLNLSKLHEYLFGEPFVGAHRARVDVEALARCYFELVMRGEI